jgi:hypothetical protein
MTDEITFESILFDDLMARGQAAVQAHRRNLACILGAAEMEAVFLDLYPEKIRTMERYVAAHEIGHALARHLYGPKQCESSIAVWTDATGEPGGICGPVASLTQAKEQSGTAATDQERIAGYVAAHIHAGYGDPVLPIRTALQKKFYRATTITLARELVELISEKGFISSGEVAMRIAAALEDQNEEAEIL